MPHSPDLAWYQRFEILSNVTPGVPGESDHSVAPEKGKTAFPRSSRLLRHADFEKVYKAGRRHFSGLITVFYLRREPSDGRTASGLRVGFTVGRALGGAVQRNRIKRRLREAVRLCQAFPGADADIVINPKKIVLTANFEMLLNEVRQAFVVINRNLSRSTEKDSPVRASKAGAREPQA